MKEARAAMVKDMKLLLESQRQMIMQELKGVASVDHEIKVAEQKQ